MTPAKYQAIQNKDMVRYLLDDENSFIELIAGEYKGLKGPAYTFSPVNLFNAKLIKGSKAGFSFGKKNNTGLLVVEGEIKVNNSATVPENYFALFGHNGGEDIELEAVQKSVVLVMSGEPLNEPVASAGPFVMNTESEIKQAYDDYYNGKFGYLED